MKKILASIVLFLAALLAHGQVYNPGVLAINNTPGFFTFTGSGVSCVGTVCTFSGGGSGGVSSINSTTGAFTFTGSGVNCVGTTCTFAAPIANIQITVGTTQVPANSCLPTNTTFNTATMTGLTSTNTINVSPAGNLSAVTGFTPAGATLYFNPYSSTTNTLSWQICNNSPSPITPSSSTTWNVSAQ